MIGINELRLMSTQPRVVRLKTKVLLLILGVLGPVFGEAADLPQGPLTESADSDVGFKTVAEALASLKVAKGVSFSTVRGWTIVTDEAHFTVWSFAPKSDPAYPAVVKRYVTPTPSGSEIHMKVLCESDKASCDNLVREFYNMNLRGSGGQLER